MRERMLAGEPYIADDPELARESARAMDLTHRLNGRTPTDAGGAGRSSSELLGALGDGQPRSGRRSTATTATRSTIGARTFANFGLVASTWPAITHRRRRADRARTCSC